MTARYHSTRPDQWIEPRPTRDPMGNKYAPLLPMETPRPNWFARLLGKEKRDAR